MRRYFAWGLLGVGLLSAACTINAGVLPSGETPPSKTVPPNRDPIIQSLTAHRFANATESVALWVQASDPDCDPLKVSWSVTEGMLSSTVGTNVTLTPTATKSASYITTVQVTVSDGRGGTAQGSLNIQVSSEGFPMMTVEATASPPTPEPCSTPTPEPDPNEPTPPPTPMPYQLDGRTFFLDVLSDRIIVNPPSLTITSATSQIRFKPLRGAWEINQTNNAVSGSQISKYANAPGYRGHPSLSDSEATYPTWQLFDSTLPGALRSAMTFDIYIIDVDDRGNRTRLAEPLKVYVTK